MCIVIKVGLNSSVGLLIFTIHVYIAFEKNWNSTLCFPCISLYRVISLLYIAGGDRLEPPLIKSARFAKVRFAGSYLNQVDTETRVIFSQPELLTAVTRHALASDNGRSCPENAPRIFLALEHRSDTYTGLHSRSPAHFKTAFSSCPVWWTVLINCTNHYISMSIF